MDIKFRHVVIDPNPPGSRHDIALIADVNGDGRQDIVVGCGQGEANLFWYENPSWERHVMASAPDLEAGGVVLDITGNKRLDVIAGQHRGNELYWFECPPNFNAPWPKHILENRFKMYHDQAVGDIDGDGEKELIVLSQKSGVLVYYDIPPDPYVSPWPDEFCHFISDKVFDVEGLTVVDIDGDGRFEVIAGHHIFHPPSSSYKQWRLENFAANYIKTRVAVADIDHNGHLDIVLTEGESNPGRLAWFSPPDWEPHILRNDLFRPHSLQVADFNGNGLADIFVAEMGYGENRDPRMILYINQGGARFEEVIFEHGIPTHEAKVGDLTGNGLPDIVGKPYYPESHIDVWFNDTT